MAVKIKTIKLRTGFIHPKDAATACNGYKVEAVTDSVEYDPGTIIHKDEVTSLCASRDWKVTIIPFR